ncbi:dinuclear metal center protein, YbgI/SA1388 family [Modicisalibacter ilicicola DSM 19980]|uniref:Dinuclear metal center protein, YbgI/SA1388 family n=1 Tax=Modicisalibacter ilicicola DSM 19980 TaxID=1121942 RepID=A0A1M5C7F8_9GAMM|nr:Nif3-like dinuclear metal center hexameric protein [Halomonas ilicicola]SHF50586.1 dinuclear metal center protein, YbgI/SA1388 family [Halomonas ilicicola DSM 19980]
MIACDQLVRVCDDLLRPGDFRDYTLNGLQVAGRSRVSRVMSGVTACQALLDEAVAWDADLLLVHHGYFWKNEPVAVTGMKRRRLATLLGNDINLLAYHLPLDAHRELGNNACLAAELGFDVHGCADGDLGEGLLWLGAPGEAMDSTALGHHLARRLGREPTVIHGHEGRIERVAWCTGGAQDMIGLACDAGVDAFISGEISERTTHLAREMGINYFAAGHHATERYGVQALGEWLARQHGVEHRFVDIDNPA